MAEANERPIEDPARELREELGLSVEIGALVCVDWIEPHGPGTAPSSSSSTAATCRSPA
jgi:hypothetical protein